MRWKLADVSLFGHLAVLLVGGVHRMERIKAVFAIRIRASTAANVARDRICGRSLLAVEAGECGQEEKEQRVSDAHHGRGCWLVFYITKELMQTSWSRI